MTTLPGKVSMTNNDELAQQISDATEIIGELRPSLNKALARISELEAELEQAKKPSACDDGFDTIAELCGCPHWDYAGQVIRDVKGVIRERDLIRAELGELRGYFQEGVDRMVRIYKQPLK